MYYFLKSSRLIYLLYLSSLSMQLLSYCAFASAKVLMPTHRFKHFRVLVGTSGLEPPTSRLSGVCSNQLSYVPVILFIFAHCLRFSAKFNNLRSCLVEVSGIEPLTPCLQGRCSPSWAIPPKKSGKTWLRKQMPRLTEHNLLKTNRGNRRSITCCFCLD